MLGNAKMGPGLILRRRHVLSRGIIFIGKIRDVSCAILHRMKWFWPLMIR